jgi:lipopolysaccharide biosynthesis glycosyltransferase
MIGMTIANNGYRDLAWEASKRFRRHTGLSCIVLDLELSREQMFKAKLHAYRQAPGQTVVLFDADLWFIDDCNIKRFDDRVEFLACLDPGRHCHGSAPYTDAQRHGLNINLYFNSGMMIFNPRHHVIFERAYEYYEDPNMAVSDFGEQSYLNIALQRLDLPYKELDATYNYSPFGEFHHLDQPKINWPTAIHAMGYAGHDLDSIPCGKRKSLDYYMTKYESGLDLT